MYHYLNGTLAHCEINFCVIDCTGVGYKLTISTLTFESISSKIGEAIKLYTQLSVREDGIELFGFIDESERDCYNKLTTVSGVGPKAAMSILSTLSPDGLSRAIHTEDDKTIARANGIGKKTAQRIILELRDKLSDDLGALSAPKTQSGAAKSAQNKNIQDALEALLTLGYDRSSVLAALSDIDPAMTNVGEIVKLALKKLSRNG